MITRTWKYLDSVHIYTIVWKLKAICIIYQIENDYTDLKRRVELETNEIRDKQQVW